MYTAISIKVVPEQSGKVEYERERLLGIAKKCINLLAIPSKPFALVYSTFPLCSGTTLIEIAVCMYIKSMLNNNQTIFYIAFYYKITKILYYVKKLINNSGGKHKEKS